MAQHVLRTLYTIALVVILPLKSSAALDINVADKQVFDLISQKSGVNLKYGMYGDKVVWAELLSKVRTGELQVTGSAYITPERLKWAKFTIPYKYEEVVAFTRNNHVNFNSVDELINYIKSNNIKVGIMSQSSHADPKLNEYIDDSKNRMKFVAADQDVDLVRLIKANEVSIILAARPFLYKTSIVSDNEFKEHRINAETPVAFIVTRYGKNAVSEEDLNKLNGAIEAFRKNGAIQKIIDRVYQR